MSYAFLQDLPDDPQTYSELRAQLGEETPSGLIAHIVFQADEGLRFLDVWESESDWTAFHDNRLMPTLQRVLASRGITPDPAQVKRRPVTLIDAWIPVAEPVT